jgi:hypothetical protein
MGATVNWVVALLSICRFVDAFLGISKERQKMYALEPE